MDDGQKRKLHMNINRFFSICSASAASIWVPSLIQAQISAGTFFFFFFFSDLGSFFSSEGSPGKTSENLRVNLTRLHVATGVPSELFLSKAGKCHRSSLIQVSLLLLRHFFFFLCYTELLCDGYSVKSVIKDIYRAICILSSGKPLKFHSPFQKKTAPLPM